MSRETRTLIQIESNEDVTSIRDRLSFYRGERIVLVWPEEGTALKRKLDLVLIQREAMRRQIQLGLVTHDAEVIKNATDLNISTFETIGASERKRWKRGRSRVFASRNRRPADAPLPEDLEDVGSRRNQRRAILTPRGFLIRTLLLGVFAAIGFGVFYVLVPTATIVLTPAREIIQASVQITVDPSLELSDVDIENAVLPATLIRVEIEEEASIPTTGVQNLGNTPATGEVVFINETNSAIDIPAGTIVSTSAGTPILFETTTDVTLPSGTGQEVTAPVQAMPGSTGDVGNVAPNLINSIVGPLEERADVINIASTREGESRQEPSVTETDQDRLNGLLNQILQERAFEEMSALPQIGEDQFIIVETLQIVEERPEWTRFSAQPGQIAETLTLTKRAVVQTIVVDTALGRQIVFARMADQLQQMRGFSFEVDTISYRQGDIATAGDLILFTMSGTVQAISDIDEDFIRERVTNMPIEDALALIAQTTPLAEDTAPSITVSPDLLGRMPLMADRISVEVRE